jgi:hypothetical protein
MAWIAVITAGLLEVGFATMLKLSNNFTKIWPSIGFLVIAKLAPSNTKSIRVSDLFPQISNSARRELLTSHVLSYFFEELKNVKYISSSNSEPRKLYDDVVAETAEIYRILSSWGEPAAALLLAKFENISVRTIQNRLRLAREKGLLAQPGSGKRFN